MRKWFADTRHKIVRMRKWFVDTRLKVRNWCVENNYSLKGVITILVLMSGAGFLSLLQRGFLKYLTISLFDLLVVAFLLALGFWWFRERRIIRVFPFQNLTGDDKNKAKYDALAAGFAGN